MEGPAAGPWKEEAFSFSFIASSHPVFPISGPWWQVEECPGLVRPLLPLAPSVFSYPHQRPYRAYLIDQLPQTCLMCVVFPSLGLGPGSEWLL